MTAKEAAYRLRSAFTMCEFKDAYGEPIDSDIYYDAMNMAISALQEQDLQPTCNQLTTVAKDTNVPRKDQISRQDAIRIVDSIDTWQAGWRGDAIENLKALPPAQPEYEPVKAEDFARTMSKNTIYGFMAWHGEALELMEMQGFVICKKTM
jgi:hypothetical protein